MRDDTLNKTEKRIADATAPPVPSAEEAGVSVIRANLHEQSLGQGGGGAAAAPRKQSQAGTAAHVEMLCMCGTGLKNTQWMGAQDPYVKVFVQPGPLGEDKTHALIGGGTEPKWEDIHNNRLQLDLKEGATHIDIEVWNENTISDDLIGKASVDLEQVKAVTDTPHEVALDTGGTVTIRFHFPPE